MIRWSLVTMVVLLLAPHAFAQDSASESNTIIYMDPSPSDDAAEEPEDQVNLSPLGSASTAPGSQQRLEQTPFLVSGTLYSVLGAVAGALTGGLATVVLFSIDDDLAALGGLSILGLSLTGAVVGAGQPARSTAGRCSVSSRVLGLIGGGIASSIVVGVGSELFVRNAPDSAVPVIVAGGIAAATLPYVGATYGCYKTYRADVLRPLR